MLRTVIWFIYFWVSLLFYIPSYFKAKSIKNSSEQMQYADKKARQWMSSLLSLAGCKIEIIGLEKIPMDTAVLYVGNHQSNFDIPLMLTQLPKSKGFIAKIETLKMPFVSDWMKYMRCVFMDRNDIRQQVKGISEGIGYLKEGQSIVLFPEGTRSESGALGDFKPGGLKLATKSGVPIVPVTIKGSIDLMRKGSFKIKPSKVVIIVSDPIEITDEMNKDTKGLTETIKSIIHSNLI